MRPVLLLGVVLILAAGCADDGAQPAATGPPGKPPLTADEAAAIGADSVEDKGPAAGGSGCTPRDASLLARAPEFTLLSTGNGLVTVCTRATSKRRPLSESAIDVAAAAFGPYAAVTEDVCPGGFEGCWVGIAVYRPPAPEPLASLQFGTSVGRLAVGRQGALALLTCTPLDETAECSPDTREEQVLYRLDERGLKEIAAGPDIDPRSLRTEPDGRAFTWRQGGRRNTTRWSGAPPATLP